MRNKIRSLSGTLALTALLWAGQAGGARAACVAPVEPSIDAGFSPEGSAERLVLDAICSSRRSIHLAAYTFTSPAIVRALIAARGRGVDVAVVADEKSNLVEDRSGKGRIALNLLSAAGVRVRTIEVYPIHHQIHGDRRRIGRDGQFQFHDVGRQIQQRKRRGDVACAGGRAGVPATLAKPV
ncbi:phosphatidylserine/phosphatidylglycerophosphate/cardiolipin synthase-like enzyme [Paraburkholderia sp. JPY465]